ncbi:MAG: hypothetical protein HYU04_01235 [Candidatus Wildermuthbacteria bacterium]|nr:hypothetical protein [Candidatus Wildermuthbacteria bacterium]
MQDGKSPWHQCKKCNSLVDADESHCPACASQDLEIVSLTLEEALRRRVWTKFPNPFYQLVKGRRTDVP